ncbi:hypothetical protein OF83DRAFT_1079990 [Amylostereum chailletii]|nr:hypothetical protein OF83DRAFT_1079990 [Amylostereum chailletii]
MVPHDLRRKPTILIELQDLVWLSHISARWHPAMPTPTILVGLAPITGGLRASGIGIALRPSMNAVLSAGGKYHIAVGHETVIPGPLLLYGRRWHSEHAASRGWKTWDATDHAPDTALLPDPTLEFPCQLRTPSSPRRYRLSKSASLCGVHCDLRVKIISIVPSNQVRSIPISERIHVVIFPRTNSSSFPRMRQRLGFGFSSLYTRLPRYSRPIPRSRAMCFSNTIRLGWRIQFAAPLPRLFDTPSGSDLLVSNITLAGSPPTDIGIFFLRLLSTFGKGAPANLSMPGVDSGRQRRACGPSTRSADRRSARHGRHRGHGYPASQVGSVTLPRSSFASACIPSYTTFLHRGVDVPRPLPEPV